MNISIGRMYGRIIKLMQSMVEIADQIGFLDNTVTLMQVIEKEWLEM